MDSDARFAALAERQQGCGTIAQATSVGLSRSACHRRVRSGVFIALYGGVLAIRGSVPSWRRDLSAAVLACGPRAVASHRSASQLWGLDRMADNAIDVLVPTGRQRSIPNALMHHTRKLLPADCTEIDGIAVTAIERTLMDLAAVVSRFRLEHLVDDALRRKLTTLDAITARLDVLGRQGRNGCGILRDVVAQRDERVTPHSTLERKGLAFLRRTAPPGWTLHHRILVRSRIIEFDVGWPGAKVGLEWEGDWHDGGQRRRSDRARDLAAGEVGWLLVYAGPEDLRDRGYLLSRHLERLVRERTKRV
jgi:hypothetical protein